MEEGRATLHYVDEIGKKCGCERPIFFGFLWGRHCPMCGGKVALMGDKKGRFLVCLHQEGERNVAGCGWFRKLALVKPLD